MKILLLTRYSRLGASSRLRMMNYFPALREADFDVQIAPFFDDEYLKRLYSGKQPAVGVFWRYISRLRLMLSVQKPDIIWIEKEAFQWLPWIFERSILPNNIPIVSDYDDAVFHRYDLHRSLAVRTLLGRKIDRVMATSTLVLAGNNYIAERARVAGATKIEIIPTVIDATQYSVARIPAADGKPRIGWIGSPSTWSAYFEPLLPVFNTSAKAHDAIVRAVGASTVAKSFDALELIAWSEDTEVESIQGMDIGVMPLDDSPWARGKCGYKLIQYMACGVPVVASPVGVNRDIVEHGLNGFLAESDDDWRAALGTLLSDPDLRRRMGTAGRRKVESQYSLQIWGPRVANMLRTVVENRDDG